MPKFKSKEHAHKIHEQYDVDTDAEGKYNLKDVYHVGRKRIQYILDAIPQDSVVLEVGCNSGGFLRLLMSENKCYCRGIDISEPMIKKSRAKGLNVKLAPAEEIPYNDEEYDVVLITEVLEHIYDPYEALKECKRVLRKDGIIVGSVPHPEGHNSKRKTVGEHKWHGKIFKEREIRELLKKLFKDVKTEPISWYNDQNNNPQWIGFTARKGEV